MSSAISDVRKFLENDAEFLNLKKNVNFTLSHLEYLFNGVPSGPMRNFSKFQAMSVLLIGLQIKN